MGLRLNPGEVKAMTASASKAVSKYNAELRRGLRGIRGVTNEHGLQGKAYSAFKFHMADHALVVSGLIAAGEQFANKLSVISGIVGSEILDEDKLNKSIEVCNRTIEKSEGYIDRYRSLLSDPVYSATSSSHAYNMIQYYQGLIEKNETLKNKLLSKLRKLFEIDAKLNAVVDGMTRLYSNVEIGIRSLTSAQNGIMHSYTWNELWRKAIIKECAKNNEDEILRFLKASTLGLTDSQICAGKEMLVKWLKWAGHHAPAAGETLPDIVDAIIAVTTAGRAIKSKADIVRNGNYLIIKGAPWLRTNVPRLSDVKGNRYKVNSAKFLEANLGYWLPRGERTFISVLSKTKDNLPKALRTQFDGFWGDTFRFATKKNTGGELSSVDKIGNVGKALGYTKIGVDVGVGIYENYKKGEKQVSKYVADATVDTVVGLGEMAAATACAKVGAAIGTAIPIPVVGTVVGAVAGFALGYAATKVVDKVITDEVKKKASKVIKDTIDSGASKLKEAAKNVGGFFKDVGTAVAAWSY